MMIIDSTSNANVWHVCDDTSMKAEMGAGACVSPIEVHLGHDSGWNNRVAICRLRDYDEAAAKLRTRFIYVSP